MSKIKISLEKLEKLLMKLGKEHHSGEVIIRFFFNKGGVRNVKVSTTRDLDQD